MYIIYIYISHRDACRGRSGPRPVLRPGGSRTSSSITITTSTTTTTTATTTTTTATAATTTTTTTTTTNNNNNVWGVEARFGKLLLGWGRSYLRMPNC